LVVNGSQAVSVCGPFALLPVAAASTGQARNILRMTEPLSRRDALKQLGAAGASVSATTMKDA